MIYPNVCLIQFILQAKHISATELLPNHLFQAWLKYLFFGVANSFGWTFFHSKMEDRWIYQTFLLENWCEANKNYISTQVNAFKNMHKDISILESIHPDLTTTIL